VSVPIRNPVVKLGVKPPSELVRSTSFLLKRLGFAIKERTFEAFEAAGESPYHHAVLAVLDESPRETQATIADALGYDRSWLVGLLDELEQAGLITRQRDPADRRRVVIRLVLDRAISDVASVFLPMVRAWQKIASRYSDDELRLIVEFYGQMEEALRQHIVVLRDSGEGGQAPAPR